MAVTATPQSQIQRIADTEAERSTSWPNGSRVFCLDTMKMYILIAGVFQLVVPAGGGGGGPNMLRTTGDQIINGTAFQNITGLTFPVVANTDYAFDFYITFRSTLATGFRFAVNGPAGVVDHFMTYQTVANSELVGVATWLQKHSVTFDAMTVTTATIAAGVDLHCRITGRFKCGGAGGTFAARVASEAANADLVVQRGSFGTWF